MHAFATNGHALKSGRLKPAVVTLCLDGRVGLEALLTTGLACFLVLEYATGSTRILDVLGGITNRKERGWHSALLESLDWQPQGISVLQIGSPNQQSTVHKLSAQRTCLDRVAHASQGRYETSYVWVGNVCGNSNLQFDINS